MTLGEQFCRRLIDAMPTAQARTICIMELQKWAGKTLYLPAEKRGARRVAAARSMLRNGMSPADVALAIQKRYPVTLRTAQRDVKAAGEMSRENVAPP